MLIVWLARVKFEQNLIWIIEKHRKIEPFELFDGRRSFSAEG
jgi:hypothetical protein